MQQPGYGGPLPQEVAMGPPDVQGMTPQNVPQGKIEQMLYSLHQITCQDIPLTHNRQAMLVLPLLMECPQVSQE